MSKEMMSKQMGTRMGTSNGPGGHLYMQTNEMRNEVIHCSSSCERRLIELRSKGYLKGAPVRLFEENRELIRRDVEENAWNGELQSYVSQLGGNELDASLLLLSWYGFHEASSERMRKTYARITQNLGTGDGLL